MINRKASRVIRITLGVAAVGAIAAGCGLNSDSKIVEPYQDVQTSGIVNAEKPDIIRDADGFSNIATKCDHGNRLYIVFHADGAYGSISVSPHDPSCRGDISLPATG